MNKIITKSKSTTTAIVTYVDGTTKEVQFTGKNLELKDVKLKALAKGEDMPVAFEKVREENTVYYVPENEYIEHATVCTDLKTASAFDMYRTTSGASATAIICDDKGKQGKKTYPVSSNDPYKALRELILQGINVVSVEKVDEVDKKYYCMNNTDFFKIAKVKGADSE